MKPLPDRTDLLTLEPIGVVRSTLVSRVDAPRQPRAAAGLRGTIELFEGRNFEHALENLEGWEFIWVTFWFHLNASWRPKVLPPRSSSGRKGVFSTRSPHRPNPVGLSAVRLERVEGLVLHVSDVDMVDGTPVLDIKPYVAYTDAHPGARSGWLDASAPSPGGCTPADPVAGWNVILDPLAAEQAAWIEARTGLAIRERIAATLQLGPAPHPYRRIRRLGDGCQLAIKEWRALFTVDGRALRVHEIRSGYRISRLAAAAPSGDHPLEVHRRFVGTWASAPPQPVPPDSTTG